MGASIAGSWIIFGYTAIHVISVGLTLGLAVYTARNYWTKQLGRVFTALLAAATIWAAGSLVRLFVSDIDIFVAITAFKYIGITGTPVVFVLFALLYDGKSQWVTRPVIVALSVLPVLTVLVVVTTQMHGLFYSGYTTTTVDGVAIFSIEAVGPWYWLFAIFSWTLMTVGSGLLIHAGLKRSKPYRLQLLVLLPAIGISWTTNILYVVWSWPHPALDPTPIGFAATSLLLGYGLFSTQLVDISPTARSLVFEVTDNPVLVVNQTDRIVDANDAAQPLLSDDDIVGNELTQALIGDLAEQIASDSDTVEIATGQRLRHYRYRERSDPDKLDGRVLIFTEITKLQNTQEATEQAHEQLRQIIDLVPDPLYVKTLDDEVLLSNAANAELHGLIPETMEGTREETIESDVENIENFDKYQQREIEVIETGNPLTHEETLVGPNGNKHTFRTTRIPFKTARKAEDAVLGYARDITEIKEYERELEEAKQNLEESHEQIEQTNEELETLNRILRHDIRNDVVVMSRLGAELEQHVDKDGAELLEQLLDRGEHIRNLTTGLRDLMRTVLDETCDLRPVRLDATLESEVRDITRSYEDAVVTIEDVPRVHVQANQMLSSVFRNLLENAILHNDSEIPEVTVSAQERTDRVEVRISDNGPGVPEDIREDIFGKGEKGLDSKGTGIGLYLVTQLLDDYGGEAWIEDNDPTGATFVVELLQESPTERHSVEV
ncbi:sensor histidine kinase [Haloplanus natans]|uniref:sensor histidine kinase n=1 Tax=Haloplanus natans TaxID=376171 RepID=UPI0006776D1D|nr:histidine kinase N-terminal 7TM domain-containing protein [Haloplanus natans]